MTDTSQPTGFDAMQIQRMFEETRKFAAEQHKLSEEASKFAAEQHKFSAEQLKLSAEAAKLSRDRDLSAWQLIFTGMGAAAALIGATAAFIKLVG